MNVFLSYSRESEELADRLAGQLTAGGMDVFYDRRVDQAGEPWSEKLGEALRMSDAAVFVIGPGPAISPWQQRELTEAVGLSWAHPERRLVPVLIGPVEPPAFLRDRQAIRIPLPHAAADIDRAADALRKVLKESPVRQAPRARRPHQRAEQASRLDAIERQASASQPTQDDLRAEAAELKRLLDELQPPPAGLDRAAIAARLADVLKMLGETAEAVVRLEQALQALRDRQETDTPAAARLHGNLSRLLRQLRRLPEAREHAERALALHRAAASPSSVQTATAQFQLANVLDDMGEKQEAQAHRRAARDLMGKAAIAALWRTLPAIGTIIQRWQAGPPAKAKSAAGENAAAIEAPPAPRGRPVAGRRSAPSPAEMHRHSIFINCPFDNDYEPLLDALLFTAVCTGFHPVTAYQSEHLPVTRIDRIVEAIFTSRYSIHDLSRLRGEGESMLARFNMPLELGIALGRQRAAKAMGEDHYWLVLVPDGDDYRHAVSDLAGFDPVKHDGSPQSLVPGVMRWLYAYPDAIGGVSPAAVLAQFALFRARKAVLKNEWAAGIPWEMQVQEALALAPRV